MLLITLPNQLQVFSRNVLFGATLLLLWGLEKPVLGIGLRHDLANTQSVGLDNPYVSYGAGFDAVVNIKWTNYRGSFQGTGTLVSSTIPGEFKILTAAHIVDGSSGAAIPDGLIDASKFTVEFGDNASSLTHRIEVAKGDVTVHPRWAAGDPVGTGLGRGAAQFDLALMTFTSDDLVFGSVSSLPTGYNLWSGNPSGQVATLVGFGRWGVGDDFSNPDGSSLQPKDGTRRAGTNFVDAFDTGSDEANDGLTIRADFDASATYYENRNVPGLDGPSQWLEASTAKGDSGGPLLISDHLVAGVLHGGYNPFPDADISEYGDVGVWASVGDTLNRQFLHSNGVAYYHFGTISSIPAVVASVPEPNTSGMLLVTLAVVLGTRASRDPV